MFITSERQSGVEDIVAVDPDSAGFQLSRNTVGFGDVVGPYASRQAARIGFRRPDTALHCPALR